MVKNLSSNAGDTGSIPGQGTKLHIARQLSPSAVTPELAPQQRPRTAKKEKEATEWWVEGGKHRNLE